MKQLSTAEETYTKVTGCIINHRDIKQAMIEFAKLHVQAALESAAEKAEIYRSDTDEKYDGVDHDSILNAYPKNLIK